MMKLFNKIIFMVFFFMFIFIGNVFAEECSYTEKANLNKLASYVKVAYEIINDENGAEAVEISIYNITEDIYVSGTNDFNEQSITVSFNTSNNGVYKFRDYNLDHIINYKFVIWSKSEKCSGALRNINFTKPMKNNFASLEDCKYSGMKDYVYCKEWLSSIITYQDWEIEQKIKDKRESLKKTILVDRSDEVKKEKIKKENNFMRNKVLLVTAFIIAIIIDIIVIVLLIERVRRYNI